MPDHFFQVVEAGQEKERADRLCNGYPCLDTVAHRGEVSDAKAERHRGDFILEAVGLPADRFSHLLREDGVHDRRENKDEAGEI